MMKFRQYLKEQRLLLEDRLGKIKDIFRDKIDSSHDTLGTHKSSDAIIDHFANHADPTKNKEYTQWTVNKYRQKDFRQEDHPRIREALSNFHEHKSKLEHKDINKYKSISDIEDAVEPHLGEVSNKEEKRQVKSEGADLIHSGSGVTIHHIKTKDAACAYGAGTRWCTSGEKNNMFNDYNEDGPIHVIQHQGRKYQFHLHSDQFNDEKDRETSIDYVHPDIQQEMMKSDHPEVKRANLHFSNPYVTEKHLDHFMEHGTEEDKQKVLGHPKVTEKHITMGLKSLSPKTRSAGLLALLSARAYSPGGFGYTKKPVTKEHLDMAIRDKDPRVRLAAVEHDSASPEHLTYALKNDPDPDIRSKALYHDNATVDHIRMGLKDGDPDVQYHAGAVSNSSREIGEDETDETDETDSSKHSKTK